MVEEVEFEEVGEWVVSESGIEKRSEQETVRKRGVEKLRVLSDVDVLASEVLSNRKLLVVFLALGERPRQAKELVSVRV